MTRPESLFEAASYDLNKFRERRLADRRFQPRAGPDRRIARPVPDEASQGTPAPSEVPPDTRNDPS